MVALGYMAKRVHKRPTWLQAPLVADIYSVSSCISEDFADYISYWKHNGYWLFDSPEINESWRTYGPEPSFVTNVTLPSRKHLEGFDVVTFTVKTSPECSPLSCNSMAYKLTTNAHCLFDSFEEARARVSDGSFSTCEPGPYRIYAVYSVHCTETQSNLDPLEA